MAVVELPVVAFAESHHFWFSGAVFHLYRFEAFEEVSGQFGEFCFEVFARAQEETHKERFEAADTAG